jgi:integrase
VASISKQPGGQRTIQFTAADGKRKSIRLGKVSEWTAEGVKLHVEALVIAAVAGHPVDGGTARWVAKLETVMHDKLSAVGLVPKRESAALGEFITSYVESRTDLKESSRIVCRTVQSRMLAYFPAGTKLQDVTPGDADSFARWLRDADGGNLSEATARKTVSVAKQIFRAAVRKRLIAENPFADLSGGVTANRARDYFVSRDEAAAVLEACPDDQWRLLFALSRYGGLRCPSEHLALRWDDIDWDRNRFRVRSSKTEHHEGKGSRWVPIFPELAPYLLDTFSQAPDGVEFVITRYRKSAVNLRTQLQRIIRRAGLEPWPKLWHNLRATRQTELAESFPHTLHLHGLAIL